MAERPRPNIMPEQTDAENPQGTVVTTGHTPDAATVGVGVDTSAEAQTIADQIATEYPARPTTRPVLTRRKLLGGALATALSATAVGAYLLRQPEKSRTTPTPASAAGGVSRGETPPLTPVNTTTRGGETPTLAQRVISGDPTRDATPSVGIDTGTATATSLNTATSTPLGTPDGNGTTGIGTPGATATTGVDRRGTPTPGATSTQEAPKTPDVYTFTSEILNPGINMPGAENLVEFPFFKGLVLNPNYPDATNAFRNLSKRVDAGSRVAYRNYQAEQLKYKYGKQYLRAATDPEIEAELDNTTAAQGFAFDPEKSLVDQAVNTTHEIIPGPLKVQLAMIKSGLLNEKFITNAAPITDKVMIRFSVDPKTAGRTMIVLVDEYYKGPESNPARLQKVLTMGLTVGLSMLQTPRIFDVQEKFLYNEGLEDPTIDKLVCLPDPKGSMPYPTSTKNYTITPLFVPTNS